MLFCVIVLCTKLFLNATLAGVYDNKDGYKMHNLISRLIVYTLH